jgi:hypothetical protein
MRAWQTPCREHFHRFPTSLDDPQVRPGSVSHACLCRQGRSQAASRRTSAAYRCARSQGFWLKRKTPPNPWLDGVRNFSSTALPAPWHSKYHPVTDDKMIVPLDPDFSTHKPRPHRDEPGTLGEQFRAIVCAIRLGDAKATSAAKEWQAARRMVLPHAKGGSR